MTFWQQVQAFLEKVKVRWDILFHYETCPFGPDLQRFWDRRFFLFSKFDQGIKTDLEGVHTITPEKTAREIAANITTSTVVDAFCGVGGSAIAFARVCTKVYACDIDSIRLSMAKHNAGVYGYRNIEFVHGDFRENVPDFRKETIFLDPPWGGSSYREKNPFTLKDFSPPGQELLDFAFRNFSSVILRVPFNFDLNELQQFNRTYKLQDHWLEGRLISRTVYFHA